MGRRHGPPRAGIKKATPRGGGRAAADRSIRRGDLVAVRLKQRDRVRDRIDRRGLKFIEKRARP